MTINGQIAANSLTFDGEGTIQGTGTLDLAAPITLNGGVVTIDTNGCKIGLDGQINGVGGLKVIDSGSSGAGLLLILADPYSGWSQGGYTGGTEIEGGTLQIGSNGDPLGYGGLTIDSGGQLDLNGDTLCVYALSDSGTIVDSVGGGVVLDLSGNQLWPLS